jgi:hypothetical protein
MSWPTPQDYNEALQNPRVSFDDPDLRNGTPELTPLGLPRAITGGFASVYRIQSSAGHWAVRCFLRDFADHKERYAAIGRHIAAARLPYTVGFQFLEKGIRVRGKWHPILKMEWIEALSFPEYIEDNIGNPLVISTLADRWIAMLRALKKHSIAHADLQHGNVLISGGDFRLIDYDGMFVPALAGRTSHEVGHRNYQHPARREIDFGAHLDNFSGWMIYLTLIALSVDSSLWSRFGRGEEHLLFRKDDLDQPRFSRVFRSLEQLKDDRIQKYLPLFRSFLGMGLSAIASPADVIGVPPKKRETHRPVKPAWSQDVQLDLFAPKPAPPTIKPVPKDDVPVVQEARIDPDLIHFNRSCASERVLLGFYGAFIFTILTLTARGTIPLTVAFLVLLGGFGCIAASLTCSYMSLSEVRAKLQVWFALEWRRTQGELVRYGIARLHAFITQLESKEMRDVQRLAVRVSECTRREKKRIAEVRSALSSFVDELAVRKAALDRAELDETSNVLGVLQSRHNALLQEGAFLVNVPVQQLERPELKGLLRWRARVEELARVGPPIIVSAEDQAWIRRKYEVERRTVRESETFARDGAQRKIQRIRSDAKRFRESMDLKRERRRVWFERVKKFLRGQIESGNSWLDGNQREVTRCLSEMNRYREIRLSRYLPRLFGVSR